MMMKPSLPSNHRYSSARHVNPRSRDHGAELQIHHKFKKMKPSYEVIDLSSPSPIHQHIEVDAYQASKSEVEPPFDPELEKLWRDIDKYCDSDAACHTSTPGNVSPIDNNTRNSSTGVEKKKSNELGFREGRHYGGFDKQRGRVTLCRDIDKYCNSDGARHTSTPGNVSNSRNILTGVERKKSHGLGFREGRYYGGFDKQRGRDSLVHRPTDSNHFHGNRNRTVRSKSSPTTTNWEEKRSRSRSPQFQAKNRSFDTYHRTTPVTTSELSGKTKMSSNLWDRSKHRGCLKTPMSTREDTQNGFTCRAQDEYTLEKGAIGHKEDRERVMKTLSLFRALCNELRLEDKRKKRIDYEAARVIKGRRNYVDYGKHIGAIPGVEVGDEFFNRMEVAIVGLHNPPEAGIDFTKHGADNICTSIVAKGSGEYANDMGTPESLIYCGHGGNVGRVRKEPEDQSLVGGNLALKNSIYVRNPIRVIRGNKETGLKGEAETIYIYDGLYTVERYWRDTAAHGKLVFKFKLRRIPRQPMLSRSQWMKLGAI